MSSGPSAGEGRSAESRKTVPVAGSGGGEAAHGLKVVTVVGARPQFVKAAPVSRALRAAGHTEYLLHTGQHYDHGMSGVFFQELEIPRPDQDLEVGSGSHGAQTGAMLAAIEEVLVRERPDGVLVFGDTNSTLAGALAACKLRIPLAHVEAGLRSFNRDMPEEHNRVLTDHCADFLFCPTETARAHLAREGIERGVVVSGDPMYDAVLQFSERADGRATLERLALTPGDYLLATIHRPYNTDAPEHLAALLEGMMEVNERVVFPAHPRVRERMERLEGPLRRRLAASRVTVVEPLGYLDMIQLQKNARLVLTDSGGVQKEAYFLGVPCITLRPETEWVETLDGGWNHLLGEDRSGLAQLIRTVSRPSGDRTSFGSGDASERIVTELEQRLGRSTG